jgi:hypothetical protein
VSIRKGVLEWMRANDIPDGIPDDAELHVDEDAGRIVVEVLATDDDGNHQIHARCGLLTRLETFPLKVPPPAQLLDAYQHTMRKVRADRSAAEAIRRETALRLVDALGLNPIDVFAALDMPVPHLPAGGNAS